MTIQQSTVNWVFGVAVMLLIGLLAWLYFARVQPDHRYLGSHEGTNAAEWTGLRGYLKQTARDLRGGLDEMNCRIWMLGEHPTAQHPYNTQPRPVDCPPGPPGLVPKDPP